MADLHIGCVLEVISTHLTKTAYGPMTVMNCVSGSDGRQMRNVMAPERFFNSAMKDLPSIFVYFGKKVSVAKTGAEMPNQYHDLKRVPEEFGSVEEMSERAKAIRKMPIKKREELTRTIESLKDFPVGTVFLLEGYRVLEITNRDGGASAELPVCKYSTVGGDGKTRSGEIFLPVRLLERVREVDGQTIAVYKGQKNTIDGKRTYSSVSLLDERAVSLISA